MKRVSPKRRQRQAETDPWRDELIAEVNRCEYCGIHRASLIVHEIARGPDREAALNQRYAVLVLCQWCHDSLHRMAGDDQRALGLALIRRNRPWDFSLGSYWSLTGRQFPYSSDVTLWIKRLAFIGANR